MQAERVALNFISHISGVATKTNQFVKKAGKNTIVVADGTSCRHQINDGTGHKPIHVARILEMALE